VQRGINSIEGGQKYTFQVCYIDVTYKGVLGNVINIIPVDEELVTDHLAVKYGNKDYNRGAVYDVGMASVEVSHCIPAISLFFHDYSASVGMVFYTV